MLEDIKAKESERINEVIAVLEKQKAGVEEKYRKLAEEETAKLTTAIESYNKLLTFWDDANVDVVERPKRKRRTKAEMEAARIAELPEDERVVDTLAEESQDEDYISQQEIDNRNIQFPDEKIEVIEEVEPVTEETVVEETPEPTADEPDWETETESKAQEDDDDDNSWPEFPSEWK